MGYYIVCAIFILFNLCARGSGSGCGAVVCAYMCMLGRVSGSYLIYNGALAEWIRRGQLPRVFVAYVCMSVCVCVCLCVCGEWQVL